MNPNKKKEPKNDTYHGPIGEKPIPPERTPVKEPEVGPEIMPEIPNTESPGRRDIPPIRAFISRLDEGYW
jgi:hypothetical protein